MVVKAIMAAERKLRARSEIGVVEHAFFAGVIMTSCVSAGNFGIVMNVSAATNWLIRNLASYAPDDVFAH